MPQGLMDLFTDETGEIAIAHNGDLLIARDDDCLAQEALWRVKTSKGDWMLVPECGADLELLIGEPNTPLTGAMLENQIAEALTNDGFFNGYLQAVRGVPLNQTQLMGIIELQGIEAEFDVTALLDLREGLL